MVDPMPAVASPTSGAPKLSGNAWILAPIALALMLAAFEALPVVSENPHLVNVYAAVPAILVLWALGLVVAAKRSGRVLGVEPMAIKSHYVQACVQGSIMAYWAMWWPRVGEEAPLVLSQLVYIYALDALLSWSRGRNWRLGFGPMPIVISTNLLLWFKHDWYVYQFGMITLGALGKQFITWMRDGRRMHIFNPSAFGQFVFALGLIFTATTTKLTWGREMADFFHASPHMMIVTFLGGLIVQAMFGVTLMTFAAAAAIVAFNLIYTGATDVYWFVNTALSAPVFLGLHLLITDPATSPRSNVGKVIFGSLYGLLVCLLFRLLDNWEVPVFWDKLLPVPLLNLCVPLIDRVSRAGFLGSLNRAWEGALKPAFMNAIHMGLWTTLFITMIVAGMIEKPHPGDSVAFWKKALADGKPFAGHSLVMVAGAHAKVRMDGDAANEIGLILLQGTVKEVHVNPAKAAEYFAMASQYGSWQGSYNVAMQHLFPAAGVRQSMEAVARAFTDLEAATREGRAHWKAYYAVGLAYESGKGYATNPAKAADLFTKCGPDNVYAAKGLARLAVVHGTKIDRIADVVRVLDAAAAKGDAEACWCLAYLHQTGRAGGPADPGRGRALIEAACRLKSDQACAALNAASLPPYVTFQRMSLPAWATKYGTE